MLALDLIPRRRLEYEPPSNCHDFGIGEALGAIGLSGAAAAPAAAATGAAATIAGGTAVASGASAIAGGGLSSFLPSLSTIGTAASIGGTLLSANAAARQADYQQKVAEAESVALGQKANDDAAAAERAQITQDRRTDLTLSRARALSAASGAGATDPTELVTEGNIAQQGDYNALSSLYEGQSRARSDTYQADIDLFKGQQAEAALPYTIGSTILSGVSNYATNRAQLRYYTKVGGAPYYSGGF